jgi:hypothetical protein
MDSIGINWNQVNYVLNHKAGTFNDIQNAIWYFTNNITPPVADQNADYLSMVQGAIANPGYTPGAGDVTAVICYTV